MMYNIRYNTFFTQVVWNMQTFASAIVLVSTFISHPLSPCMLLSGFLYALLFLSDQLLLSFALVFASVLHDFVSLTKKNVSG